MAVRILCVFVVALAGTALALDSMDNPGIRIALRVFNECSSKSEGMSPCLKKKALTFLDRFGRMDKLDITDELAIVKVPQAAVNATPLTEDEIDKTLARGLGGRDQALTDLLWNKVTSVVRSKNLEFTMPRMSDIGFDEARKGGIDLHQLKKKLGGHKHKHGFMMHMMMGMMGKMMGLIPAGIAGLFLLAGKALITSKIALLLAGIIAIKKLAAAKNGGGGGGGGHGGGHGGGFGGGGGGHHIWASGGGGGGGWDRRSLDDSQKLAYNSYAPH